MASIKVETVPLDDVHHSKIVDDNDDDHEEHYGTDNEEEHLHDHVLCEKCGTMTHVSSPQCSNTDCNAMFKFSKSGYLVDDFICEDGHEDDDDMAVSSYAEEEYVSSSDMEDEEDDDDDEDLIVVNDDEDTEYTCTKTTLESVAPNPAFRRVTRSMKR